MNYDLIIKNGKTINGDPIEVAVQDKKIVEVAEKISGSATQIIELADQTFISAGWIDDHVHCFEKMDLYYDYPYEIGV